MPKNSSSENSAAVTDTKGANLPLRSGAVFLVLETTRSLKQTAKGVPLKINGGFEDEVCFVVQNAYVQGLWPLVSGNVLAVSFRECITSRILLRDERVLDG